MSNNPYISNKAFPDTERSLAATSFNGTSQNIGGVLNVNPIIIIFDNSSDVSVPLYIQNVLWKTFPAGEALVLDMRANMGQASTYTFPLKTQFSTNAAVGTTGSISISILYGE